MKYLTLILILTSSMLNAQFSLGTQNEVDSFNINNPDSPIIPRLNLRGLDISNLDSLYSIEKIESQLNIDNTSLVNLDGLENLVSVSTLNIQTNENLVRINLPKLSELDNIFLWSTEIEALDELPKVDSISYLKLSDNSKMISLSFLDSFHFDRILLQKNENLTDCQVSNLCNHLNSFNEYIIYENGVGCNNRDEIVELCLANEPFVPKENIFYDDFETWTSDSLPSSWYGEIKSFVFEGEQYKTIDKSNSCENSDTALELNTVYGSIPAIRTPLYLDLASNLDTIDIKFDYCSEDSGFVLFSSGLELRINEKLIWHNRLVHSGNFKQDSLRSIHLRNVPIPADSSNNTLSFRSVLLNDIIDITVRSNIKVDNFEILHGNALSTENLKIEQDILVYPNPSSEELNIKSNSQISSIQIFNSNGRLIKSFENSKTIDISGLKNGFYFLKANNDDQHQWIKFIKSN